MATAVRQSNTDGITQCVMSRATPEATECCHWATTHSVLPQRPPGQQQSKQWQKNWPALLAVLMAAAVRRYNTAHITQWRRSRALVETTRHHNRASIAANSCNRSRIRRFFWVFFMLTLRPLFSIGVWLIKQKRRAYLRWVYNLLGDQTSRITYEQVVSVEPRILQTLRWKFVIG